MQTISQKRARFFATARELGYTYAEAEAATVHRYDPNSDGRSHTTFTASVVTNVPETRIQEVDYAVFNRIEKLHGSAAVLDLI